MEGRSVYVENVGLEWKNVVSTSSSVMVSNNIRIFKIFFI